MLPRGPFGRQACGIVRAREGFTTFPQARFPTGSRDTQHSGTLTASPPCEVSL
jgi:hypothetical protein